MAKIYADMICPKPLKLSDILMVSGMGLAKWLAIVTKQPILCRVTKFGTKWVKFQDMQKVSWSNDLNPTRSQPFFNFMAIFAISPHCILKNSYWFYPIRLKFGQDNLKSWGSRVIKSMSRCWMVQPYRCGEVWRFIVRKETVRTPLYIVQSIPNFTGQINVLP